MTAAVPRRSDIIEEEESTFEYPLLNGNERVSGEE